MRRNWLLLAIGLLIGAFAVAGVACDDDDDEVDEVTPVDGTPPAAGTVSVLGIWGAEELDSFEAMVAPWEADTGGRVAFTGERGVGALITTRVEAGDPPDIAIPAEVGLFQDLAREGHLTPLSSCQAPAAALASSGSFQNQTLEDYVRENYPESFVELGTVDGVLYGFFMKTSSKGTIWYNPTFFEENGYTPLTEDSTFDDLVALTEEIRDDGVVPPWSIGVESEADSGWPGTDWIQQILLNEFEPSLTDGLIDGSIPFTDDRVAEAWEMFGEIALPPENTVQGGPVGINATNFIDATFPPFRDPPEAAMNYLGGFAEGFITEQFPDAVPETDFDFFPWPGGGVTGDGNIVYAFNDDADTCSLMAYLATGDAQQIWVDRGGFTSLNREISVDSYPGPIAQKLAEQLLTAPVFRFDLDDAIGGALQRAFFAGVTQYLDNPDTLDDILEEIEASRGIEVEDTEEDEEE